MDFLKAHPGETVFMRIVPAGTPENIPPGRTFEMTFRDSYWTNPKWKDYFWFETGVGLLNPTLGRMRGKIVILQEFDSARHYGMPYKSFDIQDHWNLRVISDLYDKWLKVQNHMRAANTGPEGRKFMNYLSGSSAGVRPFFVASGHVTAGTGADRLSTGRTTPAFRNSWPDFPRVACVPLIVRVCTIAYEGTNILTYERLKNYRRVGVIMSDFPGPGLIDETIKLNDRYKK